MDDLPQRDLLTTAAVGNCRRALAVQWERSLQWELTSVSGLVPRRSFESFENCP